MTEGRTQKMTDDSYIQKIIGTTPDFQTELARKIQELAPEVITDGKVDTQKLKELLDSDSTDDSERFGLFWPGKKRAMRAAQEPTTATLKPAKDESKNWDTTENLFIEGDNLEVLKVLQKQYHNRVSVIYVDPPYNTGKDFVYPDNYKEGLASYLEFTKQVDSEGRKVSTNSDTDGRYHSNWLNMMYPRLKLARNLLSDDGIIFISIDDNELDNLTKICNEIFGEDNFVAVAPRKTGAGSAATRSESALRKLNDYVLIYTRSNKATLKRKLVGQKEYPHKDENGDFMLGQFQASGSDATRSARPKMWYPIYVTQNNELTTRKPNEFEREILPNQVNGEDGRWLWSPEKFEADKAKLIHFDGKIISRKIYFDETQDQNVYQVEKAWFDEYRNASGTKDVEELFGIKKIFDHPKPTGLIKHLVDLHPNKNGLVLDFFSGSGTTAHAVMLLNATDGGNRKNIQVQLPEPTDNKSPAFKNGYRVISDISKERIRRAGDKIVEEHLGAISKREKPLDTGFRVYKLADTNFTKWSTSSDTNKDAVQQQLLEIRESSNDAANEDDLLTEVLLKQGISLTAKASHDNIDGLSVWNIGDTTVLAYLDESVKPSLDQLRAVANKEPAKFIILEDAFKGDDELKTNLTQICRTNKIELWTI